MAAPPNSSPISADEAGWLFSGLDPSTILIAVSGGVDSVTLMWLLARWAGAGGGLKAATVEHGLRPESRREAAEVAALAGSLGVAHAVLAWSGPKPMAGIEAAAREARYALLEAHARAIGATTLVTAHTRDDQAETVLMRLAAGSGPAGLAAMRPVTKRALGLSHVRPLLDVPKTRLIATLVEAGIGWSEDAMNGDSAFARARLRAAAPALAREGLTTERLAVLARRMARIEDALEAAVDDAWQQHVIPETGKGVVITAAALALADEVILRLLRRAIARVGRGNLLRLERLEALADEVVAAARSGGQSVRTLAGTRVAVEPGGIRITTAPPRRSHTAW